MVLEDNKKKILMIGVISIVVIVIASYYLIQNKREEEYIDFEENSFFHNENTIENIITEETEKMVVHISGQIANPGVITLNQGARLIDAIDEAGGITEEADLSKVNLAYLLEDAQKIYIPSIKDKEDSTDIVQENAEGVIITNENSKQSGSKEEKLRININTAGQEELQKLPGIGSSIALRIITYRKENGKFNAIEEIKNVSGIGESKFNRIKDNIYVK